MKYAEIHKLIQLLLTARIPFTFKPHFDGCIVALNSKEGFILADAIEHKYSIGHENDLLEIAGAITEEELKRDSVLGNLTADEVFERFEYCYECSTSLFRKNNT